MKALLGAALGTGLYAYSSGDGSSLAVRMAAYLTAALILAASLMMLSRAAVRNLRSFRRKTMYAFRSKQIVQRDGLRVGAGEPAFVSATVIVLDEPALARLLVLEPA